MRNALLLVLVACGADGSDGPDPHALGPCHPALGYPEGAACEYACSNVSMLTGEGCPAARNPHHFMNHTLPCADTFEHDGLIGCCYEVDTAKEAWFFVCD
jgi:hypothetical protein